MEHFPASYVIVYQRVTSNDIQKNHPNKVVSKGGPKMVFSTHNSITLKRNLRLSGSGEIHQPLMKSGRGGEIVGRLRMVHTVFGSLQSNPVGSLQYWFFPVPHGPPDWIGESPTRIDTLTHQNVEPHP